MIAIAFATTADTRLDVRRLENSPQGARRVGEMETSEMPAGQRKGAVSRHTIARATLAERRTQPHGCLRERCISTALPGVPSCDIVQRRMTRNAESVALHEAVVAHPACRTAGLRHRERGPADSHLRVARGR